MPKTSIGLRDVGGQRQHHVIDEELVGFVRPAQPLAQGSADMADGGIIMPDRAAIERIDAPRP